MTTSEPTAPVPTRAGFVAVIGAPNAGKSTLVNRLVGAKVSIVTQKVQTTRFPVRGVAMAGQKTPTQTWAGASHTHGKQRGVVCQIADRGATLNAVRNAMQVCRLRYYLNVESPF